MIRVLREGVPRCRFRPASRSRTTSAEQMNVLLLAHGLPVGGAEVMIAALARWLHREAVGVEVGCLDLVGSLGEALRSEGVPWSATAAGPGRTCSFPGGSPGTCDAERSR